LRKKEVVHTIEVRIDFSTNFTANSLKQEQIST